MVVFQAYICFGAVSDGVVIVAVKLYSSADTAIQAYLFRNKMLSEESRFSLN